MKVLITSRSFGQIGETAESILRLEGHDLIFNNAPFDMGLFNIQIQYVDALIIGAHLITKDHMASAKKLKIIAKHGAGLDNIDLESAHQYGIKVTNTPGLNANAVADLAFGLMINCARKIHVGSNLVKSQKWERIIGTDVYQKKIGLLGFGSIAKCVAKRAYGFDMEVMAYDPFIKEVPKNLSYVKLVSFDEILRECDFLSVHVPLNKKTENLIAYTEMKMMKRGAIIINTSRGGIVNEEDLLSAIEEGHIASAGFDVLKSEPPNDFSLIFREEFIVTPHMGMYSEEAIDNVSIICAENVANCLIGGALQFEVN